MFKAAKRESEHMGHIAVVPGLSLAGPGEG